MSKKLWITVEVVEDGGLLVWDKVYPEKKFVFVNPRGFYEWLCQQMGTNAKPDSPTHCGRVVVDANKLERLERIEAAARAHYAAMRNHDKVYSGPGSATALRLEEALRK